MRGGIVGRTTMHDDIPRVWIATVPDCESMQTDGDRHMTIS